MVAGGCGNFTGAVKLRGQGNEGKEYAYSIKKITWQYDIQG